MIYYGEYFNYLNPLTRVQMLVLTIKFDST